MQFIFGLFATGARNKKYLLEQKKARAGHPANGSGELDIFSNFHATLVTFLRPVNIHYFPTRCFLPVLRSECFQHDALRSRPVRVVEVVGRETLVVILVYVATELAIEL